MIEAPLHLNTDLSWDEVLALELQSLMGLAVRIIK